MTTSVAISDVDLFSDEALTDPYPIYQRLRDTAPVIRVPSLDLWVVPRYDDVRAIMGDWQRFKSGEGVTLNPGMNQAMQGSVLASDPPYHDVLRGILAERLSPRALRRWQHDLRSRADDLITTVLARGSFDGIANLARVFPPSVVADLIGIPHAVRPRLIPWGDSMFNAMGPENARMQEAMPVLAEHLSWLNTVRPEELLEGSMGRAIFEAADAGVIEAAAAPMLLSAYTSAALDTTISAIGSALWLFATHPEQYQQLRDEPSLLPRVFNEVLRFESPVQCFTRVLTESCTIGDTAIPAGDRLAILIGSANRDERHYGADADRFDITRASDDHLAFGYGLHGCAGQGLARMEAAALLGSLINHVAELHLISPPVHHLNNLIRGLESLPLQAIPA